LAQENQIFSKKVEKTIALELALSLIFYIAVL